MIKVIVPISGGKDSQACAKLAVEEFGSHAVNGLFCDTNFEHPLTYEHVDRISNLYGIKIHKVCAGSVEEQIRKYKRFPGGGARFCTKELKILPSKRFYLDFVAANGPFEVWWGMRAGESSDRRKRYANKLDGELYQPHEVISNYPKKLGKLGVTFRLPILNWTEQDVFNLLNGEENPLYSKGFSRVGCFPCLAAGDRHKERAFQFDEVGREHFLLVRGLEPLVGRSIFTSKGGQNRNDGVQLDCFTGCTICSI